MSEPESDLADTVRDCRHVHHLELALAYERCVHPGSWSGVAAPPVGECPYSAELHGGQRCRCCDNCRYSCAQDI